MKDVSQHWCEQFTNKLPNDLINIYSYQHKNILSQLDSSDFITGYSGYDEFRDEDYKEFYSYMMNCYKSYTGIYDISTPLLWAWPSKPNHRQYIKHSLDKGELVRIDARVPKSRLLVSNFDIWSAMICTELKDCGDIIDKLFVVDNSADIQAWGKNRCYQGVIDKIYIHEIKQIKSCST